MLTIVLGNMKMIKVESNVDGIILVFNEVWYLEYKGEYFKVDNKEFRLEMMLLGFLELKKEEVLKKIENKYAQNTFPLQYIMEAGFLFESQHWTSLAVNWLVNENKLTQSYFIDNLITVVKDKKYSQKTRQKAKKILYGITLQPIHGGGVW